MKSDVLKNKVHSLKPAVLEMIDKAVQAALRNGSIDLDAETAGSMFTAKALICAALQDIEDAFSPLYEEEKKRFRKQVNDLRRCL